jgi:hypothetical protein
MKLVYMGHICKAPSFYVRATETRIEGYSKSLEAGDIIIFDKSLEKPAYRVLDMTRRNYNGVFKNAEDGKNAFFDASVERITPQEALDLRDNHHHLLPGHV